MADADGRIAVARRRAHLTVGAVGVVVAALALTGIADASAQGDTTSTSTAPTTTTVDGAAPTTTTTAAPYDPATFSNGEASGNADTFTLNVKQGNANIGFTFGRSMATYTDVTGSSEARALDLGVFPVLFGVEQCDGSAPVLNPATFPPLTRADSTDTGSERSRRAEAFMPGMGTDPAGPSAGFQDATAAAGPSSRAVTDSADADLFLVALSGGHTEVTTSLEDDVREAHSVVTADQLKVFGGLFTFNQPRWEAVARSGRVTTSEGRFTFASATVLGFPRDAEDAMADLAEFSRGLEELLAPLGVAFELPSVQVEDGRVRVTPMSFKIVDPPWGAQVIAPFLANVQPLREQLVQQALDEDCRNETSILLLDVILGVVAGSGSVEIMAGGVEARTDDTVFPAPLPPIAPPQAQAAPTSAPTPGSEGDEQYTPGSYSPGYAGTSPRSSSGNFAELELDDLDDGVDTEVAAATATRQEELTAMPSAATSSFEDSDAGRAAVAVGLLGLLGALGLTFGERLMSRRSRRRIP